MRDKADNYRDMVNRRLAAIFSVKDGFADLTSLHGSMKYSIEAGGKRIRPLLSAAACEILDTDFADLLGYACAIEMIHTYSLIHDDLPALDNDDFRRGKPSNHKVYGEGTALLAGDALLNKAAEMLFAEVRNSKKAKVAAAASEYIMKSAGPEGMLAGQAMDIDTEKHEPSFDSLLTMHSLKTGKMIKASLGFPAVICEREELFSELEGIADSIGLAFQIKDDILDVEGEFDKLGKSVGKDMRSAKVTFATTVGIERSKIMLGDATESALEGIRKIKGDHRFLEYLIMRISDRDN